MRLTEKQIEEKEEWARTLKNTVHDTATLRRILRDGLAAFERDLKELAPDNREEVLNLYLNKTRKLLFAFHMTLCAHNARARARKHSHPTRALIRESEERYDEEARALAKLYRFL
jgi:hypothetical protein